MKSVLITILFQLFFATTSFATVLNYECNEGRARASIIINSDQDKIRSNISINLTPNPTVKDLSFEKDRASRLSPNRLVQFSAVYGEYLYELYLNKSALSALKNKMPAKLVLLEGETGLETTYELMCSLK